MLSHKGNATVMMDKTEYTEKLEGLVRNGTYSKERYNKENCYQS